jgi:hypothetical protein
MYRYFAYGSVLSMRHLAEWSAEHGVDARLFAQGTPAVLRGHALIFDVESRFWGGKVADLATDEGGTVHGVLFELPPEAREAVLRKEGVPTGLSMEVPVRIEAAGKQVDAHAFIARPERRTEPGAGSGRLLGYLVEGARERGLPQAWIERLEGEAARAAAGAGAPAPAAPARPGLATLKPKPR